MCYLGANRRQCIIMEFKFWILDADCLYLDFRHMLSSFSKIMRLWSDSHYGKRTVISDANSKGSGEPAHAHSLARTFAVRSRKW